MAAGHGFRGSAASANGGSAAPTVGECEALKHPDVGPFAASVASTANAGTAATAATSTSGGGRSQAQA